MSFPHGDMMAGPACHSLCAHMEHSLDVDGQLALAATGFLASIRAEAIPAVCAVQRLAALAEDRPIHQMEPSFFKKQTVRAKRISS
jgi:hypothetical protein